MAELVVPLSFWANTQVEGAICCVKAVRYEGIILIITGNNNGTIALWHLPSFNNENKNNNNNNNNNNNENYDNTKEELDQINDVKLQLVMVGGHSKPVTALTGVDHDLGKGFMSVSVDGTICIWSYIDGRCLISANNVLGCSPTSLVSLPNGKYVACAGRDSDIEIVSIRTLEVTSVLSGHSNWVNCLYSCDLPPSTDPNPILISAGMDGIIHFWSLRDIEQCFQSLCLEENDGFPLSVYLSPKKNRYLLVVTENYWILYTAKEPKQIMRVKCPTTTWSGGNFVNERMVVIWTKEGTSYLYGLPKKPDAISLSLTTTQAKRLKELIKEEPENLSFQKDKEFDVPIATFEKSNQETNRILEIHYQNYLFEDLLFSGSPEGKLTVWKVRRDLPKEINIIKPFAVSGSVKEVNQNKESIPSVLANAIITTSTIIEQLLIYVTGYDNGYILIRNLPKDSNPKLPQLAHKGAVKCLLKHITNSKNFLISGGQDSLINVWEIKNHKIELFWKFQHHTGPIDYLLLPSNFSTWKNHFFSVSEDKNVGLFALDTMSCKHLFGVHSSTISVVKWIPEQDYLLVLCESGSLSIWELSSGELESTLFGPSIPKILESSQTLNPIMENITEVSPDPDSSIFIRSLTIMKSGQTPVQCLLMDIKKILAECKLETLIKLFTYFLPWGLNHALDKECQRVFKLDLPNPMPSFAIKGKGRTLSLLTPLTKGLLVWQSSHYLTASHTLAGVSIAKKIMGLTEDSSDIQNLCSQLLSFYCGLLPEKLKDYSAPSLHFLVEFWRDPDDDIMQATRSIFIAATNRMSPESRKKYIQSWAETLKDRSESQNLAILVLAILACHFPDSMDKALTSQITNALVKLLSDENRELSLSSIELFGKGVSLWRTYIRDLDDVIQRIFHKIQQNGNENSQLNVVAQHSLLLVGNAEPQQIIISLRKHIVFEKEIPSLEMISNCPKALGILSNLIRQSPYTFLPYLPLLTETIVHALDLHIPYLRDKSLRSVFKTINILTKNFPMVSFHSETQRLLVGSKEGKLILYDLKSASKMHVIDAHKGMVSVVSFSESGKTFVTHSVVDSQVKFWKLASSFLSLMNVAPSCVRSFKVNDTAENIQSSFDLLEGVKITWENENKIILLRSWEGSTGIPL